MKRTPIVFLLGIFLLSSLCVCSQQRITRDIKSFGAKGNGKTNDHAAFVKAATFFNNRGGNGTLVISPGTYLVGKQIFTKGAKDKRAYEAETILHISNVKNMRIDGAQGSVLKYADGLRYGTFDPVTGKVFEHGNKAFTKREYQANLSYCILIEGSNDVSVTGLTLNGNSDKLVLGGSYGDVGRQIEHYGIYIRNSLNIVIDKMNVHHFALDGICVDNDAKVPKNNIRILNSVFEYNARQGLSWIGGNGLFVKNCKFNHMGRGKFVSSPGAGLDIEAENGPVRNGVFENCEFVDNAGAGVVADSGDGGYCTFTACTFWGTTYWSVWITKPGFTFTRCNFYGSFVHGYDAPDEESATKFYSCNFEDKPYNGKQPYGTFLIETNGKRRVSFSDCNFIANKKKLCWVQATSDKPEEKYQFRDCRFIVKNADYQSGDFVGVLRGMAMKNCTFEFKNKEAKNKRYLLADYDQPVNINLGGNKIVFAE